MKRIEYLDRLKFLLLCSVIIGHVPPVISYSLVGLIIHSFIIPIFFLLSGFFIKPLSFSESVRKHGKRLLLPTLLSAVIVLIFYSCVLVSQGRGASVLNFTLTSWLPSLCWTEFIDPTYFSGNVHWIGILWFFFALFWSSTIYSILLKHCKTDFCLFIAVALLFLLSYGIDKVMHLPLLICEGLSGVSLIFIGNMFVKHNLIRYFDLRTKVGLFNVSVLFVMWVVRTLYLDFSFVGLFYNHCNLLTWAGSLGGCLCILLFAKYVKIGNSYLGQLSMTFICVHAMMKAIMPFFVNETELITSLCPYKLGCFVIYIIAELLLTVLVTLIILRVPIINRIYEPKRIK